MLTMKSLYICLLFWLGASLADDTNMMDHTTASAMDSKMSGHDMSSHDMSGHDMTKNTSSNDSNMDHSGHSATPAGHHLQAFFFLSTEATILFEQWVTSSQATFIGSCIGIAFIAVVYEGLKLARELLMLKEKRSLYLESKGSNCSCGCTCLHLLQTLLHMVQMFISYCLMLIFMLFNTWLCLSVILGSGLGYLIFGWKKRYALVHDDDHCQ